MHCKTIVRISTGQALPVSTTSASKNRVQQLRGTISIGIVNGELKLALTTSIQIMNGKLLLALTGALYVIMCH